MLIMTSCMWKRSKEVRQLDARYSVGSDGLVYSGGLPLKAVRGVWVCIHGERRYVSYLVARAFVPNPEGRKYVVHRNGVLEDNRAENLEWSDVEERGRKRGPKAVLVPVVQYDLDGRKVGVYDSASAAADATGLKAGLIRSACGRRGGRSGGFYWRWL